MNSRSRVSSTLPRLLVRFAQKVAVAQRTDVFVVSTASTMRVCYDAACAATVIDPTSGGTMVVTAPASVSVGSIGSTNFDGLGRHPPWAEQSPLRVQALRKILRLKRQPVMCTSNFNMHIAGESASVTLIELVFVVVIGVAVAGILAVYTNTVRYSADPVIRKQMLAIAESMLEEVKLMPFTYCDPDDVDAATAGAAQVGVGNCAALVEVIGPEPLETRYSAASPFDNVNDYHGFDTATAVPPGIADISGTAIPSLAGYRAQVTTTATALSGIAATDGNGAPQVLLITVTVTASGGDSVALSAYRTRFAPNALP